MDKQEHQKKICHSCQKEVAESVALSPEGKDYVYYFCCTQCQTEWIEMNDTNKDQK